MKEIKVLSLIIRNFKGIGELVLHAENGESINIFGPNASGKTSTVDAFNWCIRGKNAQGDTKFQVKPLDGKGKEIHHIETEVEVVLAVNGERISFKRVQYEKWSKEKPTEPGAAPIQATFTNTQKYYVDEVPTKTKKAFEDAVNNVLDEKTFTLLMSPTYFNEELDWKERRKKLFEIGGGELSDDEVIASNTKLKALPGLLNGKNPHERKLQADEQLKNVKQKLNGISHRLEEAARNLPQGNVTESDQHQLKQLSNDISELQAQKIAIQSGAAITNKHAEIKTLESDIHIYQNEFSSHVGSEVQKLKVALQEKQANVQIAQSKVQQIENDIQNKYAIARQISETKNQTIEMRKQLLAQHEALKKQVYMHPESDCTCPTCKQVLPVEQVEAAKKTAEEQFNLENSKKMAEIASKGAPLKEQILSYDSRLEVLQKEVNTLNEQLEPAQRNLLEQQQTLQKVEKQLVQAQQAKPTIETDEKHKGMQSQLAELKHQLVELQDHAKEALDSIDVEITKLQTEKLALDSKIAQFANVESAKKRIEELQNEQLTLNEQQESLEYVLYLIGIFERTKAEKIEERINALFSRVKVKLFEQQVSGGIKETCEMLYPSETGVLVSYQNGLNTAAKMNAGIDVINALQKHYGIITPIFLDNRESVTDILPTDAQTISFFVSGEDEGLRIESVNEISEPLDETPPGETVEQPSLFDEVV